MDYGLCIVDSTMQIVEKDIIAYVSLLVANCLIQILELRIVFVDSKV